MRVTIVPSDGVVVVDGVAKFPIDLSFMGDIHAVQWYETWGEIERVDPTHQHVNERIVSIAPFQTAIDLWGSWVAPVVPTPPEVE